MRVVGAICVSYSGAGACRHEPGAAARRSVRAVCCSPRRGHRPVPRQRRRRTAVGLFPRCFRGCIRCRDGCPRHCSPAVHRPHLRPRARVPARTGGRRSCRLRGVRRHAHTDDALSVPSAPATSRFAALASIATCKPVIEATNSLLCIVLRPLARAKMSAAASPKGVLSECTGVERSVYWQDGRVHMIDQQLLPAEFKVISCGTQDGERRSARRRASTQFVPQAATLPRTRSPALQRSSRRSRT